MAVKSTSSTTMAPMTSLARRDSVGTDTGGRMATGGLLLVPDVAAGHGTVRARVEPRRRRGGRAAALPVHPSTVTEHNAPAGDGFPPPGEPGSARGRGASGADVGERGEGVVEGGHPGQGEPRLRRLGRLGAVAGRGEERRRADALRGDHLELDAADRTHGPLLVDGPRTGDDLA